MTTVGFSTDDPELARLYSELAEQHLQPLWELRGLLTPEPAVRSVPFRWPGHELRTLCERAGSLVPVNRGGDRRVLACANPGLGGAPFAVSTLWAAVQYLAGGERAPAHRHTPAALRFVLGGTDVCTLVDGDPLDMTEGDLVLTPSWTVHEHHSFGRDPMMWLDVLDLPMVAALDAVFYENSPGTQMPGTTPASEQWFGMGPGIIPAVDDAPTSGPHSPLLVYRWAATDRALDSQLAVTSSASARIRFTNPVSGGDVLPTMRCEMVRVPPGSSTVAAKQTGGRVACVLHGAGYAAVGPENYRIEPGDVIAIPSWAPWHLRADEQLDVFSVSDAPVLEALGLFRHAEVAA